MNGIRMVSRGFIDNLFDSPDYKPRGLFICMDTDGESDRTIWVAVNNKNGEALTEEFNTRLAATRWLNGYKIRNRYGELLNG